MGTDLIFLEEHFPDDGSNLNPRPIELVQSGIFLKPGDFVAEEKNIIEFEYLVFKFNLPTFSLIANIYQDLLF